MWASRRHIQTLRSTDSRITYEQSYWSVLWAQEWQEYTSTSLITHQIICCMLQIWDTIANFHFAHTLTQVLEVQPLPSLSTPSSLRVYPSDSLCFPSTLSRLSAVRGRECTAACGGGRLLWSYGLYCDVFQLQMCRGLRDLLQFICDIVHAIRLSGKRQHGGHVLRKKNVWLWQLLCYSFFFGTGIWKSHLCLLFT